jgi:cytochrome c5
MGCFDQDDPSLHLCNYIDLYNFIYFCSNPNLKVMKKRLSSWLLIPALLIFLAFEGCYYDNEEELYPGTVCDTAAPSYLTTIKPIISGNCTGCHGGASPTAGLSLTSHSDLTAAITNRNLMDHLTQQNGFSLMPPSGRLSNCRIDQINAWIVNGMPDN